MKKFQGPVVMRITSRLSLLKANFVSKKIFYLFILKIPQIPWLYSMMSANWW